MRAIAQEARVNHGQVHHIFGGKDGLKRAMLAHLGAAQAAKVPVDGEPGPILQAAAQAALADPAFVRALARRLLEEPEGAQLQDEFPVVGRLREVLDASGMTGTEVFLGEGMARALGWRFFGPWIRQAVKLSDGDCAEIEDRIANPALLLEG